MARIVVIGAGVMGTAFTLPASDRGHEVRLVGTHLDRALIEAMKTERRHPRLRSTIGERVTPYQDSEIDAAMAGPIDLIVYGVATAGVDYATDQIAPRLTGPTPIVLLSKGVTDAGDRIGILPDAVIAGLKQHGAPAAPVGAIGGPCIAGELAVRRDTASTLGFPDLALATAWVDALSTPYYQLRPTTDLIGLELCAAFKNFYAIGVGIANGRMDTGKPAENGAFMHNAAASLFAQVLPELEQIVATHGGDRGSVYGLPGLGDLYVTCQAGRNSRLGRALGAGHTYASAMAGPLKDETVEGAQVAQTVAPVMARLAQRGQLDRARLPLAHAIIDAITTNGALAPAFTAFHHLRPAA